MFETLFAHWFVQLTFTAPPPPPIIVAEVSAYNTLKEQTDSNPCESASTKDICGRTDVLACPSRFEFGTKFKIKDKVYTCEDRMNKRYRDGNYFDISFDKNKEAALAFGRQKLKVILYE